VNNQKLLNGESIMNKKIVALILVVALALCSLSAASSTGTSRKNAFSVGVGLGTNSGVALKYGMGNFDVQGNVGIAINIKNSKIAFSGDVGAFYNFYNINFNTGALTKTQTISLTTGPVVALNVQDGLVAIDANWTVGGEYTFNKVPVTVFLKLGLGCGFALSESNSGVDFPRYYGVLGALYTF